MSSTRDAIFTALTSSQTSEEDFQKALALCGIKSVEKTREISVTKEEWKTEGLAVGAYPEEVTMVKEKAEEPYLDYPLSAKDIYQVYLHHVLKRNRIQLMLLEKFMEDNNSVFNLDKINKQVQDFLVKELAVKSSDPYQKQEKQDALLDFSNNNKLRLSVVVSAIKTLRSDLDEQKKAGELLQSLETKLAMKLKKALIGTAKNYADRNQETLTMFHQGFEARANKLKKEAKGITTLNGVLNVILKNIHTPAEGTFKKMIQPNQFKDGSLNAFLLQTMTAPENRAAFCLALNIRESEMPAYNENHTEKTREAALKKLGLIGDEIVPGMGMRLGSKFGDE